MIIFVTSMTLGSKQPKPVPFKYFGPQHKISLCAWSHRVIHRLQEAENLVACWNNLCACLLSSVTGWGWRMGMCQHSGLFTLE